MLLAFGEPRIMIADFASSNLWKSIRVFLVAGLIPVIGLVFCALAVLLFTAIVAGKPLPDRQISSIELLPPLSALPNDYEFLQEPRWAGANSSLGLGHDEDAYAKYRPTSKPLGQALIIVYHEQYSKSINREYDYWMIFLKEDQTPDQVMFQSERAQRWTIRCSPEEYPVGRGDSSRGCTYLARYDEFTIYLQTSVGPRYLSWAEFENLIRAIETQAIEVLDNEHVPPFPRE